MNGEVNVETGPYKLSDVIKGFEKRTVHYAFRKGNGTKRVYLINIAEDAPEGVRLIKTHDPHNPLDRQRHLVGQNFSYNDFEAEWFIERSV